MSTTLIRGGTVVNHDHSQRADVLIENGRIVAVGSGISGDETIDAGGCYVMPGGIDPHTHMELMFISTVSADEFEWGTKAAISGGTTMIVVTGRAGWKTACRCCGIPASTPGASPRKNSWRRHRPTSRASSTCIRRRVR